MGQKLVKETPSESPISHTLAVMEPPQNSVCAPAPAQSSAPVVLSAPAPVPPQVLMPSSSHNNPICTNNTAAIDMGEDWSSDISDDLLFQSAMTMDISARRNYTTFAPVFTNCSNITINFGHKS